MVFGDITKSIDSLMEAWRNISSLAARWLMSFAHMLSSLDFLCSSHDGVSVILVAECYTGTTRVLPFLLSVIGKLIYPSMLDEPRAADAHLDFIVKLKKHDIPCSAFQMSSGYTVAETEPKTRNVFTWNSHRFPDPRAFTAKCHADGIRLIANVKPYALCNHPDYKMLKQANALFTDPAANTTAVCRLWSAGGGESGIGSHVDFTSKAGYEWWVKGIKALREVGIDGAWNDNNEFTIPNDDWELALEKNITSDQDVGMQY